MYSILDNNANFLGLRESQPTAEENLIYTLRLNQSDTDIAFENAGFKTTKYLDIIMKF